MIETELRLPLQASDSRIVRAVEISASGLGLILAQKGTLAKYPGCIHWHFTKAKLGGTLEVTYWPRSQRRAARLWFKVARNRQKPWTNTASFQLKRSIRQQLMPRPVN
jgi:hypothetical protein